MRIQDLDQIPSEAISESQFIALDDPSQTFKVTLGQLQDFLLGGVSDNDDLLTIELARPGGAVAGFWYPVLIPVGDQGANVTVDTWGGSSTISMNNNQFAGFVHAGGWSDAGDMVLGVFHQYDMAERAIHSIHTPTESNGGIVFYVHEAGFPVKVKYHTRDMRSDWAGGTQPATGLSLAYGSSVFDGTATPGTPAGSKTKIAMDFGLGSGAYSSAAGKLLGSKGGALYENLRSEVVSGTLGGSWGYSGKTSGGSFADMWGRRGAYHADVSHTGSSYAPVMSCYFHDTEGWDGTWSQGPLGYTGAGPDSWVFHYKAGSGPGGEERKFEMRADGQFLLPDTNPTATNSATSKQYVDERAARWPGDGNGGASVSISLGRGANMFSVVLSMGGKWYPLTGPITSGASLWIRNRGGENADRDYDFGVSVSVSGGTMTLTSQQGANAPGLPGIGVVAVW